MIKVPDINELSPSELFSEHTNDFVQIKEKLLRLYNGYPNKYKIITLLDYWLFSIYSLKRIYGNHGLISFCESNLANPQRFSFLYEFSNQRVGHAIQSAQSNKITFFILKFFTKRIYIPGAELRWLGAKILNRISAKFIASIPENEDEWLKDEIFQLVEEVLSENFSPRERHKVKTKLPRVFYSNMIKLPGEIEVLVKGSCASFLEFSGIEKLFLLDKSLKVRGNQHGGGYDIFDIDYFAYYEKKLSDEFYGWGFSKLNLHQGKFQKLKIPSSDEKRLLWIEDSSTPALYFTSMPYHYYQSIDLKTKSYIYTELKNKGFDYSSLYHPSSKSPMYEDLRRDDYLISGKDVSEKLIRPSDILIFDNAGSTLIHFAIENHIVFYLVISKLDFERFTFKHREFFCLLKKYGFGLFNDENSKLTASIEKITGTKNYSLPSEVVSFYKENFFVK